MSLITLPAKVVARALASFPAGRKFLPRFLMLKKRGRYQLDALFHGYTLTFAGGVALLKKGRRIFKFSEHPLYFYDEARDYFDEYFNAFETERDGKFEVLDFSTTKEQTLKFLGKPLLVPGILEGEWTLLSYTQQYMPKEGDIVLDIGAYCGGTALYFSTLVGPTGRVYAFEPDENNYEVLCKNIESLGLTNVTPVKKGLFSHTTTLRFNTIGSAFGKLASPSDTNTIEIEVLSLSDAYQNLGLTRLDFVKMDIEGAELEVIEGAKDFLKDKNINFAIASYHRRGGEQTYLKLEKMFKEIGYAAQTGYPHHLTTWASKAQL